MDTFYYLYLCKKKFYCQSQVVKWYQRLTLKRDFLLKLQAAYSKKKAYSVTYIRQKCKGFETLNWNENIRVYPKYFYKKPKFYLIFS